MEEWAVGGDQNEWALPVEALAGLRPSALRELTVYRSRLPRNGLAAIASGLAEGAFPRLARLRLRFAVQPRCQLDRAIVRELAEALAVEA